MIHCEQYTGYAVGVLEAIFYDAAKLAGYPDENIFWSYKSITDNKNGQAIACDYRKEKSYQHLIDFIKSKNINKVIAFDMPYPAPALKALRQAGVEKVISYWGASMSSINSGLKLYLKKLEWLFCRNKPDGFVFESEAMRLTATHGRGVPLKNTYIVHLGVDTDIFYPNYGSYHYAHKELNIDYNKKIIFYSGHMEERKGVKVIVKAAIELVDNMGINEFHFVFCGNKSGEAIVYQQLLEGTKAEDHVTFAGYRNDIPDLMRSSFLGVIASTGWDSFTMSSVEMMASGLPVIVSNLQGLAETIEAGANGFHIEPGNHQELAQKILHLGRSPETSIKFSEASRLRAVEIFSRQQQVRKMASLISTI